MVVVVSGCYGSRQRLLRLPGSGVCCGETPPLRPPAADVGGVTLPPASTAASGCGQGRPGRTRTDGCPEGVPRASAVPIIKHPCNPKSEFCCIPIAIQLQEGLETEKHMPGIYMPDIYLVKDSKTRKGYGLLALLLLIFV